jgi:hypothetical protein
VVGFIQEPELKTLVDLWSPVVVAALEKMGDTAWPPYREKQGLLRKPRLIPRFTLEGPIQRGADILWSVSHTVRPSFFDQHGHLTKGQREYWIVALSTGEPASFRIDGAHTINISATDSDALRQAIGEAQAAGPRQNTFYGNRGPLSHR